MEQTWSAGKSWVIFGRFFNALAPRLFLARPGRPGPDLTPTLALCPCNAALTLVARICEMHIGRVAIATHHSRERVPPPPEVTSSPRQLFLLPSLNLNHVRTILLAGVCVLPVTSSHQSHQLHQLAGSTIGPTCLSTIETIIKSHCCKDLCHGRRRPAASGAGGWRWRRRLSS